MLEDAIETLSGGWGLSLALLAGGALLLGQATRPAVKTGFKGWFAGRDSVSGLPARAKALVASAGEQIQDLYAEARAEMAKTAKAAG